MRPADFPPPFDPREFVAAPSDPPDERIDVGVLIVGAGPAGLACAIRLGQLLEDSPELAEQLGEVPVAVLEKGKSVGSHLVSGAVVNPRGLRRLFRGRDVTIEDVPSYGRVDHEGVYYLSAKSAMRIPTPPTMRNDGNFVTSLSQLSRWLAEQAEAGGAAILPETAAEKLLVEGARTVGVRTGDKGRGKDGEPLGNYEPGSDVTAKVTVLAEGTQGHLTGIAIDRFGMAGENPQVWALGVKEVWKVEKPLDRVVHTLGWPLRGGKQYREFGGSFIYPMGDDMVTIGMVVGLDYRDVELSVHDLLQELKTHKFVRKILRGGERIGWGAKTIPEGRVRRPAAEAARARPASDRGRRGLGERTGAERHPLRDRVRAARGGGGGGGAQAGPHPVDARRTGLVRRVAAPHLRLEGPGEGSQHAPGVRPRLPARRRDGRSHDGQFRQASARQQRRPSGTPTRSCSARSAPPATRRPTAS